jgi:hypothetical protein
MMSRIYSLLLLTLTISTSCTEEIKIDLSSSSPELVVEGVITNEVKAHTIYLKKSGDYFMNQPVTMISGAVVSLSDGQNNYILNEDLLNKGAYSTENTFAGIPGRTYSISIANVDVDGDGIKEQYAASCLMIPLAPVDSISVEKKGMFRQDIWAVKLSIQDSIGYPNYYLSRTYINDVCKSDSIDEWGISNDELFDGVYLINETIMFFRSRKPDEKVKDGDKVSLEVCAITEDYMKYIFEVGEEFRGRNPLFGGQPANIRTNVKRTFPTATDNRGARGYFAAYSVGWGNTIYRELKK